MLQSLKNSDKEEIPKHMKIFIYPEMMVHVPMCTHKNPKSILVARTDSTLIENELERYRDIETTVVDGIDILGSLRNSADKSVDVLLLDVMSNDAAVFAHVNRLLKDDALMVLKHPDLDDIVENTKLIQILGNYFKIIMPYHLEDGSTLLLCSKEYHPTADLILQRSDLLEGHHYYNCDVHIAAFAMPQYIRKNYLGIIRN